MLLPLLACAVVIHTSNLSSCLSPSKKTTGFSNSSLIIDAAALHAPSGACSCTLCSCTARTPPAGHASCKLLPRAGMALSLHGVSWVDARDLIHFASSDEGGAGVLRLGASCACGEDDSSSSGGGRSSHPCNAAEAVAITLCDTNYGGTNCSQDEGAHVLEAYEWLEPTADGGGSSSGKAPGGRVYSVALERVASGNSSGVSVGNNSGLAAVADAGPAAGKGIGGEPAWQLVWAWRAALAAGVGAVCSSVATIKHR